MPRKSKTLSVLEHVEPEPPKVEPPKIETPKKVEIQESTQPKEQVMKATVTSIGAEPEIAIAEKVPVPYQTPTVLPKTPEALVLPEFVGEICGSVNESGYRKRKHEEPVLTKKQWQIEMARERKRIEEMENDLKFRLKQMESKITSSAPQVDPRKFSQIFGKTL